MKPRKLTRLILLFMLALTIIPFSNITPRAGAASKILAAFTYNPCVMCAVPGDAVFFNATTSLSTLGPITSYTWNFGDQTPPLTTNNPIQTHVYFNNLTLGQWRVSLTTTDTTGTSDTITQLVEFNDAPSFTVQPDQPIIDQAAVFNASTTKIYFQQTIPPSNTFLWSFGDGTSGTGIITSHTYQAAGPYRVILTVTTSQGSPTISKNIIVKPAPPNNQIIHLSFDDVSVTISATLNVNNTTETVTGTVSVVATNATTGTVISTKAFNLTLTIRNDENSIPRFLIKIASTTPREAVTCTVSPTTALLSCFLSRNPDLTDKGTVDIIDFSVAAFDYGSNRGDARYNPAVDLNNDGTIDIIDVSVFMADYAAPIY